MSVAAHRLVRNCAPQKEAWPQRLHEAQRRHVVVVGCHADHALAAVSARPLECIHLPSTLSLASPASETRHPWRGCEDRAYICAYSSTDPLRKTNCSRYRSDKPVRTDMRRDSQSIYHEENVIFVLTTTLHQEYLVQLIQELLVPRLSHTCHSVIAAPFNSLLTDYVIEELLHS